MTDITTRDGQYFVNGERVLYSIVRHKKRGRIGVVAALKVDDRIKVGYSLCCKMDKFQPDRAAEIAIVRCLKKDIKPLVIYNDAQEIVFVLKEDDFGYIPAPHTIQQQLQRLYWQAHRKYKLELPPEQEEALASYLAKTKERELARIQRLRERDYKLFLRLKARFEPATPATPTA